MSFLKIQRVSKSFSANVNVLEDFSLQISKGEVFSLIGESGSGKSTLLRIIAGKENRDSGEVILGKVRVQNPKEKLVPGYDEIQLVYQDYKLFPNSTVAENIARPLLEYDKGYREARLKKLLKLLNLESMKDKLPRELSGGQQQKVAIGRALSLEPSIVLLDEPFSSLDTIQRRELIVELKEIFRELEMTVLFVTHDLDDALQMSDHLVIIQKGKIIQQGEAEGIFMKPKSMYAAKLFSHLNSVPSKKYHYIRPSDVELYKSKGLRAKVQESQYLIHYNQLTIKLSNGDIWKVEDKRRVFKSGDRVYLKWNPEKEIELKK